MLAVFPLIHVLANSGTPYSILYLEEKCASNNFDANQQLESADVNTPINTIQYNRPIQYLLAYMIEPNIWSNLMTRRHMEGDRR